MARTAGARVARAVEVVGKVAVKVEAASSADANELKYLAHLFQEIEQDSMSPASSH